MFRKSHMFVSLFRDRFGWLEIRWSLWWKFFGLFAGRIRFCQTRTSLTWLQNEKHENPGFEHALPKRGDQQQVLRRLKLPSCLSTGYSHLSTFRSYLVENPTAAETPEQKSFDLKFRNSFQSISFAPNLIRTFLIKKSTRVNLSQVANFYQPLIGCLSWIASEAKCDWISKLLFWLSGVVGHRWMLLEDNLSLKISANDFPFKVYGTWFEEKLLNRLLCVQWTLFTV